MPRRILVITKDPEFDDRGEVVLGQCEPFTSGWKLVLILDDKKWETLLAGTYTDLRKIQESCGTLEDPERVRRRVTEMRALLNSSVTETVAVDFGAQNRSGESSRLLEPTQTGMMPAVPADAQAVRSDGFFEIKKSDGVLVALVTDTDRSSDVAVLNQQLRKLLEDKPKAIVLDLSRIPNISTRVANELKLFHDHCKGLQISFVLCSLRKSVQKLLDSLDQENMPATYADSESALAVIAAGN